MGKNKVTRATKYNNPQREYKLLYTKNVVKKALETPQMSSILAKEI
jgi:hypothetical protein